jgi:nitrate/nitrite-specific signal transduction histidine kinase
MLVKSTQRIARGDFSESIPPTDRQDEIGNLQESFNTMQQSLAKNIEDSQKLSEELQHRNEELSATYEHVREADRIKTNFIHQMADKMIPPALFLDTAVDNMRKNPRMKPAAFRQLSDQAMQSIRTITTLIDQMFAEQH